MTTRLQPTALKSITTPEMKVTQIAVWPNGLGFYFVFRSALFQCRFDQDLEVFEIVRKANESQKIYRVKNFREIVKQFDIESLVIQAVRHWVDYRSDWTAL